MDVSGESLPFLNIPHGSSWWADSAVREALEEKFLPAYLAKARWFPGYVESSIKPKVVVCLPVSGDSTVFVLVEIEPHERFLLPLRADWSFDGGPGVERLTVARLRQGERQGSLHDVATDPVFISRLLDHLRREASIAGSGWRLDFKPTSKLGHQPVRPPFRVRAIDGEQSNSTALVDQDYVVKVYRRIEPGENPEIEMGQFLTEVAHFSHTPALLGHFTASHASESYALGVVHAFVPNRGDAWTWSADRISIYLEAMEEGSEERDKSLTVKRHYFQWVRRFGCRVAEMHRALASQDVGPFRPEPINQRDVDFWISDLTERASRVVRRLREAKLNDDTSALADRLRELEPRLSGYATNLIRSSLGRCMIRHHGDLHLGQVLVAAEDAVIIDFEGEPKRPLHDRRRKAPAARDVAGVLRSLDYAVMAARHQRQNLATPLLRALAAWRDQSVDAFLSTYYEAMDGSRLWPDQADERRALLNFFLLEKGLYEIDYELSYRPDWLAVPLRGVLHVLEHVGVT